MREDFDIRIAEINSYFEFVEKIDSGAHLVVTSSDRTDAYATIAQTELIKTLKANGFVVLYNLIESTVKNAIESIFDELESRSIEYDQCRQEIQRIVLNNMKKRNVEKLLPMVNAIAKDLIGATFRKDELFSGNLDARRIRKAATDFGFQAPNKKSDELVTVKDNRNDLAHGNKSFGEVGRDYDVARIISIKDEVIEYLDDLLTNVEQYLVGQLYLKNQPTVTP